MNTMTNDFAIRIITGDVLGTSKETQEAITMAVKALSMPSAQPKQSTEIQDILTYLDEELHPIVAPDNWNVYSELHDMISELSAQTERQWIPCSERLPEKGLRVLMYLNNAWQLVGWYDKEDKQWYALPLSQEVVNDCVLAWMPLPEPYEESEDKE